MNRLFRHDRLIVSNTIRITFASWHDRVIATLMLLAAVALVRSKFADLSWTIAAWAALIAGIMIGIGAGRLVGARLAFHTSDGLLAVDALYKPTRQRYLATWHGIGLALLTGVTLIVRPSLLAVSIPGYFVGALLAGLTDNVRMPRRVAGMTRPGRMMRAWLYRPIAGLSAAAILLVSLLPAGTLDMGAQMAVVGIGSILLALALTTVDDRIVRFMTVTGHGSWRIIFYHARGIASFSAVAVLGCCVMLGPIAAGIVAAASVAMLLLLSLRILAYRLHRKRFADFLVSIVAGVLMLVAYLVPVALPVVALAMLWQLQRGARAKTWLLA